MFAEEKAASLALLTSCLWLFVSSLCIFLSPLRMENSRSVSESRPVVLALIDLSHSDFFLHLFLFPAFFSHILPHRLTNEKGNSSAVSVNRLSSLHFSAAACKLHWQMLEHGMPSCIMKVDSYSFLNIYPEKSNQERFTVSE